MYWERAGGTTTNRWSATHSSILTSISGHHLHCSRVRADGRLPDSVYERRCRAPSCGRAPAMSAVDPTLLRVEDILSESLALTLAITTTRDRTAGGASRRPNWAEWSGRRGIRAQSFAEILSAT